MITRISLFAAAATLAVAMPALAQTPAPPTPPCGAGVTGTNLAADSRCFELRTYTVQPESKGTMDVLQARFRDVAAGLFVKHGMTIVGFWQPLTKPDTLIYLLAYKDAAAHDAAWAAFQADPAWIKARTDMSVAVKIDSVFMNATNYSPMK